MDFEVREGDVVPEVLEEACKRAYYVRVSTPLQSVTRQINDLKAAYPKAIIYKDIWTGSTMERPGWMKLMSKVEAGQITDIYMDELSRMSRTKEDGFKQWMELYESGIELHFLKQPMVSTKTYRESLQRSIKLNLENVDKPTSELMSSIVDGINKYMVELAKKQIYNVFDEAEYERKILSQRTSEGLKIAKINGKQIGRKKGTKLVTKKQRKAKAKIRTLYEKYGGPLSATDCIKVCGVSRDSFYKYIKQLDEERE